MAEFTPQDTFFLIVESSASTRMLIFQFLKKWLCKNIIMANNAQEAMKVLTANKIDFIICGWELQKTSGLEFLSDVKHSQIYKNIPFLILTSEPSKEDIIFAGELGVDGILNIPFSFSQFIQKIMDIEHNHQNPPPHQSYFNYAQYLADLSEYDKAIKIFDSIVKTAPNTSTIYVEIAKCQMHLGKYGDAEINLKTAMHKNDHYLKAYDEMGHLKLKQDNHNDALTYYMHALKLSPNNPQRYITVSAILQKLNKVDEAAAILEKGLTLKVGSRRFYVEYGKLLLVQKKYKKALTRFSQGLREDPKNPMLLNGIAICYKKLKSYKEAFYYYDLALKLAPHDVDVLFNKALCFKEVGQKKEAADVFNAVLAIDPKHEKAAENLRSISSNDIEIAEFLNQESIR